MVVQGESGGRGTEDRTRDAVDDAAEKVGASVDLARKGEISREEAIMRVDAAGLPGLLHPRVAPGAEGEVFVGGEASSPGAAVGRVVLDAGEALEKKEAGEEAVVLVADSLGPDDKEGMLAAAAIFTGEGGIGSHDLVILKGMGVPVVTGCEGLEVDAGAGEVRAGGGTLKSGDAVTVDGSGGAVYSGELDVLEPAAGEDLWELLGWADEARALSVRANAEMPDDAKKARGFGAEGIGLCRTERLFIKDGRLGAVRRLILAADEEASEGAIAEIESGQRNDLKELIKAMSGLPVAIRLLDPPLHEFLPDPEDLRERLIQLGGAEAGGEEAEELRQTLQDVERHAEANPMLGTRGVRLGILRPEIYRMQARSVARAVREAREEGYEPMVELLIPQVLFPEELRRAKGILEKELEGEDISIGATIEAPRACAAAGSLAREAPFFSFGTNDLTQTACAMSRDDAKNGFLPEYLKEGLLEANPFEIIDEEGVGRLMELTRDLGRDTNPDLKLGVCGEHGGESGSIRFFHDMGIDYVSCSPYRVPAARLAAAQAALSGRRSAISGQQDG